MPVDPFPFDPPSSLPSRAAAYVARPLLSRLATVDGLLTIYREARQGPPDGFGDRVLSALNISIAADREMLDLIPASGPAIRPPSSHRPTSNPRVSRPDRTMPNR